MNKAMDSDDMARQHRSDIVEGAPLLQHMPPSRSSGRGRGRGGSSSAAKPSPDEESAYLVLGTCRICLEPETASSMDAAGNPLICPCRCNGSSKYVHRACLRQWREAHHRADAYFQCEVCKYRYQYRRLWYAGLLASNATVTLLFVLLLSACVAVLGCVPLMQAALQPTTPPTPGGGGGSSGRGGGGGSAGPGTPPGVPYLLLHIANGVIMMGLLGLTLALVLVIARACGLPGVALLPDPWCPACLLCCDSGGQSTALAECAAASADCECCAVAAVLVAGAMLLAGVLVMASAIYAGIWLALQAALERASAMVENVGATDDGGGGSASAATSQRL